MGLYKGHTKGIIGISKTSPTELQIRKTREGMKCRKQLQENPGREQEKKRP